MEITIREVPNSDLPRNCEIETAAFAAFPLPRQFRPTPAPPQDTPDPTTPPTTSNPHEARIKYFVETRDSDLSIRYVGAYDDTTNQLIAFAKWHVYDTDELAKTARRPMRSFANAICPEACDEMFGGLYDMKERFVGGRKHLCTSGLIFAMLSSGDATKVCMSFLLTTDQVLHMLHADPAFQGRGAGGMLVAWGAKKADELGIPCYLEASKKGHSLYEKFGYKDMDVLKVDLRKWGGDEVYETPVMLREPRT